MQAWEVPGLHYLAPSNPSPYSQHFSMSESNTPIFELNNGFSDPLYHRCIPPQAPEFNPQSSNVSNNSSNYDEADEQQQSLIINERKERRKISNRDSARRSRMRKQRQLDELCSQVVWLRNENHQLMDKLNHVSECHDRALQENVQLKEETSELRQMISNMHPQLSSPY